MTDEEVAAFLAADPPHTAKVATVRSDGRPHVAPVWYALDGRRLLFTTGAGTVKGRSLRRHGHVAVCVDDERPPFSFVLLEGTVDLIEDLDVVRHWATVIGGRYMGAGRATEYGARNGVPGEMVVRMRDPRVTSARDVAD
jgi:PPOX class probable F420-dependent enzyme